MPIFSGIIAAASAAISSFFTVAGLTAAALQMAAGIGLNLIAAAIKGKPTQEKVGIQGKMTGGGDVPRSVILGQYNTAGSLTYRNTYGNVGDTPNAYYVEVRALADFPVGGLVDIWVDGEKVELIEGELGLTSTKHIRYGTKWGDLQHLWFRFYDGTQTTADSTLVNWFGSSDRPWGSDRVGKGVPYVVITALRDDLETDNPLFNGFPNCKFTLAGTKLYDPSRDSSAGGGGEQRYSDRSTWGGDGNNLPAVQIYNILRGITYNGQWLYGLQAASPAILPLENWIAAINKCRALADGPDGSEAQYRSGIQIDVNVAPADAIEALLKTCNGRLTEVGGVYTIHVGEPDTPVLSFSDADILSTEEQVYNPFRSLADSINGVVAKYPEPLEGWNVKTSPITKTPAQIVRDGNRQLFADVDLSACPYHGQIQRLLKSSMLEALRERRHTIVLPPWAQVLEPGDIVKWTSARNGYVEKWFRIDGMAYKANLDVMLQITEVDPFDYDWHQDTDYIPPVFAPMEIIRPAPQPMVSWDAVGFIEADSNGIGRRAGILLTWDGSKTDINGVSYDIATAADDSAIVLRETSDNAGVGSIKVFSHGFIPGNTYYARGRYIPTSPRSTDWSDWRPAYLPLVLYSILDMAEDIKKQVTEVFEAEIDRIDKRVSRLAQVQQDATGSQPIDKKAIRVDLIASSDRAEAGIKETQEAVVTATESIATLSEEVYAEFDDVNASITETSDAVATLEGYAAASWGIAVDVNGRVIGRIRLSGDDQSSAFEVLASTFMVSQPGTGGTAVPVFTIANVNGTPKLVWRGDMVGDGELITRMIQAGAIKTINLDALSVNTSKLAINSVGIDQVIANSMSKTWVEARGASTIGLNGASYEVWSKTVTTYGDCLYVEFESNWDYSTGTASTGQIVKPTIHFLIDGVEKQKFVQTIVSNGSVIGHSDPIFFKHTFSGVTPGSHTFSVRTSSQSGWAAGSGGNPNWLAASIITLTDLRR